MKVRTLKGLDSPRFPINVPLQNSGSPRSHKGSILKSSLVPDKESGFPRFHIKVVLSKVQGSQVSTLMFHSLKVQVPHKGWFPKVPHKGCTLKSSGFPRFHFNFALLRVPGSPRFHIQVPLVKVTWFHTKGQVPQGST